MGEELSKHFMVLVGNNVEVCLRCGIVKDLSGKHLQIPCEMLPPHEIDERGYGSPK